MIDMILQRKNRFTWMLLAIQGGYVNIGGLLTIHVFVTHITGFSAHLGNELVSQNFLKALYFSLVPVFFLFGAFFSSIFTEVRKKKNLAPVYIYILSLLSFLFFLVAILGHQNHFGTFGEPFENIRDFVLLSILAFSSGAQNAIFTRFSGSIIRTTHLTGITTDLGIGLAKSLFGKDPEETKINRVRVELIVSFIFGSILGAFVFPKIQFLGFLTPAIISALVGLRLFLTRKEARF